MLTVKLGLCGLGPQEHVPHCGVCGKRKTKQWSVVAEGESREEEDAESRNCVCPPPGAVME